jgi:hypothetical protein
VDPVIDTSTTNWSIGFEGYVGYHPSVNYVVAERVSEFFVETWEADSAGSFDWRREDTASKSAFYPSSGGDPYLRPRLWCGNAPSPFTVPLTGDVYTRQGVSNAPQVIQPNMPTLIRVTVVVHPHNDTAQLTSESYAGNILDPMPAYEPRYRGQVFREVFRINGLVQHAP